MPLSTSLPAPTIEFASDIVYPGPNSTIRQGSAINPTSQHRARPGQNQTPELPDAAVGIEGGAGTTETFQQLGGRTISRVTTTAARYSQGFHLGYWRPGWDQAAFGGGALYDPDSVVATIDFHVAYGQAAFAGIADTGGFWFCPHRNLPPTLAQDTPAGAFHEGGFGVAINDDGGGSNVWEFVSYDGVPNILQRTQISPAVVPDVTAWSTFRFSIIAAASGRDASVSLEVNGIAVPAVQGLPVDDVTIFRPNTLQAGAAQWMFGPVASALGGGHFDWCMYGRFGRFTASGAQVQGV